MASKNARFAVSLSIDRRARGPRANRTFRAGGVTTSSKNAKDQPTNPCASFKLESSTRPLTKRKTADPRKMHANSLARRRITRDLPPTGPPLRDGRDDGEGDRDLGSGDH